MSEDDMLKCLIAFVLGFLVSRMMRGNGLSVGGNNLTREDFTIMRNDLIESKKGHHSGSKYVKKINKEIFKIDKKLLRLDKKNEDINSGASHPDPPDNCTSSFFNPLDESYWCDDNWCTQWTHHQYCSRDLKRCCYSRT
jgi:hypothetical protein